MTTNDSSGPDECQFVLETAQPRYQPDATVKKEVFVKLHEEWQDLIAAKRRRKRSMAFGIAASAIVAVSLLMVAQTSMFQRAPDPFGQIVRSNGNGLTVRYGSLDTSFPAEEEHLVEGARISTASDTRVLVRLSGGGTLRFDQNTRVELMSGSTIRLRVGAVYFDSRGRDAASTAAPLSIVTPAGTVTHLGTQYMARVDQSGTAVGVREGSVSIRSPSTSMTAGAGEMIRFDRRNRATDERLSAHAPAWDWVMAIAPRIPSERSSVAEILDWIARESGRRVEYENGAGQAAAREMVAGLPDLPPLIALDALDHAAALVEITQTESLIRVRGTPDP